MKNIILLTSQPKRGSNEVVPVYITNALGIISLKQENKKNSLERMILIHI